MNEIWHVIFMYYKCDQLQIAIAMWTINVKYPNGLNTHCFMNVTLLCRIYVHFISVLYN